VRRSSSYLLQNNKLLLMAFVHIDKYRAYIQRLQLHMLAVRS
jgi:hypothetical protein